MFLYAGIARYSGLFRHISYRKNLTNLFITPHVFALKSSKTVVNSAYYLCRLGFLGAFRRRLRLGLCGGFCLGLQPFHFLLCGMESSVGVIVQRHYNVGVSHDVLQCLGVHARVCHSGTELCRMVCGVITSGNGSLWHLLYFLARHLNMAS